jgi:hypothetical protein
MAGAGGGGLGGGGLGFLVFGFAVDDAGDGFAGVLRTRFQTLITSPQVVSTSMQPLASSSLRVWTSVPKAGMMTTSLALSRAISSGPGLAEMVTIPMLRS